jgi:hypothetical protein
MRGGKPARRVEIRSPGAPEPLELVDERTVGGERPQPLRRYILQDDPRISGVAPSLRIDAVPQHVRLMTPGSAQVERQLAERLEPGRKVTCRRYRHFVKLAPSWLKVR